MSEPMISIHGLSTNASVIPVAIELHTCPHCGEPVPVLAGRWEFSLRAEKPYPCPVCNENVQPITPENLTEAGLAFLQAIQESGPIKFEDLVKAAGFSDSALKRALPTLKAIGVKGTKAGYVVGDDGFTIDDLTTCQRDILQAIQENQPVKLETLAVKAGVSEMTVTRAMRKLKAMGVKSTSAGYTVDKCPAGVRRLK